MTGAPLTRILHADDDPDIRDVTRLALEAVGGLQVDSCAGGGEVAARAHAVRPDLILLDVMMPDPDGPATLEALRGDPTTADIPVVFMTARGQANRSSGLLALGAAAVIEKPFDPMTLADQLRTIWAGLDA